jgi:hypothetical protein
MFLGTIYVTLVLESFILALELVELEEALLLAIEAHNHCKSHFDNACKNY